MDDKREWYKSCQGVNTREVPREISFCAHAMLSRTVFIVEDTLLDLRFKDNPYVTNYPFIRFYAGIALIDAVSNLPLGVFCIKDTKPRKMTMQEMGIFMDLSGKAESLLNSFSK